MATEKLNDGKSVRVTQAQISNDQTLDEINDLPSQHTKAHNKAVRILLAIILLMVVVCAARVPYVGSYVDSYVFEFLLGNAKYILYIWLILLLFFKICNFKFVKVLYTKRFLLGTFLIVLGAIIGLAIAQQLWWSSLSGSDTVSFSEYVGKFHDWANSTDAQLYKAFMPIFYFDGFSNPVKYLDAGIIGTAIGIGWLYVTTVLLGLVALILIVFGILIYANKTDNRGITLLRKWIIHLFGGTFTTNTYDELSGEKNDIDPVVHQSVEIKQEANKPDQLTPPISFLTDTSVDHYFDNKSNAEKMQNLIAKFIKKQNIEASYQSTTIMPQYVEINFEVDSRSNIDEILRVQNDLLNTLKLESFNISFKGNIVRFELPNKESSKVSMRQIFNSVNNIQGDEAVVGLTLENTPLLLDIHKHPNSIIIGRRGSGGAMLLTCILISLAYINSPMDMDFIVLSPLGDKSLKHLDNLPHMQYPVISDPEDSVAKMHDVLKTIDDREAKFKESGAKNLDDFNKYQSVASSKIKKLIFVISSFDKMLKNNLQNVEVLSEIMKRGAAVGIHTILLSINVNNESTEPKIYDSTDARFILKLESEHESLKMFDSYRGIQLCGNGDGFYITSDGKKKTRFQTCYLNANELIETIKIIKTFYQTKEQQV
ncbi:MAG: hypothetical protein LBT17_01525 [Mycoplasmataceae bacterium]|nr:hypothetical protein [Mycoplasmataceae bacterium]